MNFKWWKVLCIVSLGIAGCSGFLDDGMDSKHDPDGNVVLLDTPRMWQRWVSTIDGEVRREADGVRPPGGFSSWNERWLSSLTYLEQGHQENPQRYSDYIIKRREQAGLPPIEGYP